MGSMEGGSPGTLIGSIDKKGVRIGIDGSSVSVSAGKDGVKVKKRIGILASGRGSDFQAIVDAVESGKVDYEIAILVCNNSNAFAIERARKHSIEHAIIDHKGKEREEFDREMSKTLSDAGCDLVVLAGFMRILSPWFVNEWKNRIVNIHPALLPSFPGAHAHRDALEYGVKVTGLTIHFVDEEMDGGPIIFQTSVEVLDDDTEDSLGARVLEREHHFYPVIIQQVIDGRFVIEGRKVITTEP